MSGSAKRRQVPVEVYAYLDVAAFLGAYYDAKKKYGAFSFRNFSRRAGLRSPNHLKRVIDGERPLTADMAPRYAAAIGLDADETAYFCDLAAFSRARTSAEKNDAYRRLSATRGYRKVHRLEASQASYHANWYIPAIRELAGIAGFRADPAWIAAVLVPPISRAEAAEAISTLRALGMLEERGGTLRPVEPVITTGPETRGLHITNFHKAMLERAAASMDLVPAASRDISSLTFRTDEGGLKEVKQRLQAFRKELIALLAEREPQGDRVVQLNMQVFPLSLGVEEVS